MGVYEQKAVLMDPADVGAVNSWLDDGWSPVHILPVHDPVLHLFIFERDETEDDDDF